MNEDDAHDWVSERFGAAAVDRLRHYEDILLTESERQNLISRGTIPSLWTRHIVDSAQLIAFAPGDASRWCDIGSGAGLPGLVVAILLPIEVVLVEPRRKRAEFLADAASTLALPNVQVSQSMIEKTTLAGRIDVISARAVAQLDTIFQLTSHLASSATRFILPKGRSGVDELASVKRNWQGVFHVEQSVSDAESIIVIADGVTRRCSASR
ncbi:MAG: 16S rRNA (guanine(527)-N(7))-methyltransferase RsmG [Sphingomonas adhaesiva]|uniref:16S rRNA (guanine(527)-N(7))-methyltransferase RsmG n=1 Tax=Sphingomonas adhaesiva TaxID=28212 RepID=UPI002FF840FF